MTAPRTALLATVLLTLSACGSDPDPASSPHPEVDPTPSSASSASPGTVTPSAAPADPAPTWHPRRETTIADLDGDEVDEVVSWGREYGPIRASVVLSSTGETATFATRSRADDWWPTGAPDLTGDGAAELVVTRETGGQRPMVIALVDGAFTAVDERDRRPLYYGPSLAPDRATAYDNEFWVRHGRLRSARSVEAFPLSSHFFDVPEDYQVRVWSWTFDGAVLRAHDDGVQCIHGDPRAPRPCA